MTRTEIEFLEQCKKKEYNAFPSFVVHSSLNENLSSDGKTDEESEEESVPSQAEESEEECDVCGEGVALDDGDYNLGNCGGGYAHHDCMSAEMLKEYEEALYNEVDDEEEEIENQEEYDMVETEDKKFV